MTFAFAPRVLTGALAILAVAGLPLPAPALVEKVMTVCSGQLCPFFRPAFAVPEGWWEDGKTGLRLGVRLFVPVGETFDSAPAVIYATARLNQEGEDLTAAVAQHHETWRRKVPEVAIVRLDDVRRSDGAAFQQHEFVSPKLAQPYERVATAIDSDAEGSVFVVRLVLTAKSEAALKAAQESFLAILKSY
ncbi:MAG TPA: hypothetical protein VF601_21355 [Beijerinckiaceae bacterium]|jgi:hypothetical protein